MIDVLLVLLIIFMITLPLSRRDFDVQVPPSRRTAEAEATAERSDRAELNADGSYAINKQPVPLEQLDAKFHEAVGSASRQAAVHSRPRPTGKYGDIVRAMDVARGAASR